MRGEHTKPDTQPSIRPGSSPHARGTQCLLIGVPGELGIIPACAGNTRTESLGTV